MTGKNHDRSSLLLTPLLAIALAPILPLALVLTLVTAFTAGWAFLSPDLDLPQSRPSKRWGLLHVLWEPYRSTHKHRGRSHFPLFGTAERLLYCACLLSPVALGVLWGNESLSELETMMWTWWLNGGYEVLMSIAVGVELAALWHLACDYIWPLNKL